MNLSQAIGQVAYAHELPSALRAHLQALRLAANLVVHESYAGTAAEVVAENVVNYIIICILSIHCFG